MAHTKESFLKYHAKQEAGVNLKSWVAAQILGKRDFKAEVSVTSDRDIL